MESELQEDPGNKPLYGVWRTDKEREPGFSYELISPDAKAILDRTDLDTLDAVAHEGCDTVLKAFQRNVDRMPDAGFLGTRVEK